MKDLAFIVAERVASALDADDFAALSELLSETCAHVIRDRTLRGPEAIARSYREAMDTFLARIDVFR